jgi:hypothetical protein
VSEAPAFSFQDPNGFVFEHEGILYRRIRAAGLSNYAALVESGLYGALVARQMLVAHEPVDGKSFGIGADERLIRPTRVPFVSYPYEWCFEQWRDAALLTLDLQEAALRVNMQLRDASPFNVQFIGALPIFVDTLSFGCRPDGAPWSGYRQFCQMFLVPLLLMQTFGADFAKIISIHLQGVPLQLARRLLPLRLLLSPHHLVHVYLHSLFDQMPVGHGEPARSVSLSSQLGLVESLRKSVSRLTAPSGRSPWTEYYRQEESYSAESQSYKRQAVAAMLRDLTPGTVWDLGCNIGFYAEDALQFHRYVIALDSDAASIAILYARARQARVNNLLPLVVDVRNPSSGLGWCGRERQSLFERGPANVVLALALIHHLCLQAGVPLGQVAAFLALAGRHAIVEFVPPNDPMIARLGPIAAERLAAYDRPQFENAVTRHFQIARRQSIPGTQRELYLLQS